MLFLNQIVDYEACIVDLRRWDDDSDAVAVAADGAVSSGTLKPSP